MIVEDEDDDFGHRRGGDRADRRLELPRDVEMFRFRGPFFFGAVAHLGNVMERVEADPRVYILDLTHVPLIDASGVAALDSFIARCRRHGIHVIFAGLRGQPRTIARRMGLAGAGPTCIRPKLSRRRWRWRRN